MKTLTKIIALVGCICLNLDSFLSSGQIITTVAGGGTSGLGDGGAATGASFGWFGSIAVNAKGDIYIADGNNNRVRKVRAIDGIIETIAGTGVAGYNGDGILATLAQLDHPGTIAVDNAGNVYIAGNTAWIRKVDAATGIITRFAGTGTPGFSGDGGLATNANMVPGVFACDIRGNVYIADRYRLRKVNSSGIITTFAGTGVSGTSGDGGLAVNANITIELGIITDKAGNIYFGDSAESVRKIDIGSGIITRVAGTGDEVVNPFIGDGIPATSSHLCPYEIAMDRSGILFITDACNQRIEMVKRDGYLYTVAGNGTHGYTGDGGPATLAQLNYPEGVAVDSCGNIYIADFGNKVVRKVTFPKCGYLSANNIENNNEISLYPNPTTNLLNLTNIKPNIAYRLYNTIGKEVMKNTLKEGDNSISLGSLPPGMYILELMGEDGERLVRKVVKSEH